MTRTNVKVFEVEDMKNTQMATKTAKALDRQSVYFGKNNRLKDVNFVEILNGDLRKSMNELNFKIIDLLLHLSVDFVE